MAWNLRPYDDSQIDPFNAPDPIMPSDEPSFEGSDADDGAERLKRHELERRLEQARRNAARGHGHQSHPWHAPAAAPVSADPITVEKSAADTGASSAPAKPPRTRKRHEQVKPRGAGSGVPATHKVRRAITFIVIVMVASSLIPAMVTCSLDRDDSSSSIDEDYGYTETELAIKADAEDEMTRQMEGLLDDVATGNELARGLAEEAFADACGLYLGLSPEEAGIDSAAVVSWLLENTSYDPPETSCYVYNMGGSYEISGTVYVDVSVPSLSDVAYSLRWDVPDGIWETRDDGTTMVAEGGAAALQEELARILEERRSDTTKLSLMLSFEGTAGPDGSGLTMSYDTTEWGTELTWLLS